jgi:hypothetical protein
MLNGVGDLGEKSKIFAFSQAQLGLFASAQHVPLLA